MLDVCYSSNEDKRRRWPAETLPAIFQAARDAIHRPEQRQALTRWMQARGIRTAQDLHNACRAGRYKPSPRLKRHCDPIQPVSVTIERGGDCDQWAAVVLAGLRLLGLGDRADEALYLVSVGDDADPYRHVRVCLKAEGRYWQLDPKPNQDGAPFDVRADAYPLQEFHPFQ